jgi:hypothetical protein
MRTYRYRVQTSTFGLFLGITAETLRPQEPTTVGHHVSARIWLDTARITNTFRNEPVSLNGNEVESLLLGLRNVAKDIERAEPTEHILIAVRGLEIVETDYAEEALERV